MGRPWFTSVREVGGEHLLNHVCFIITVAAGAALVEASSGRRKRAPRDLFTRRSVEEKVREGLLVDGGEQRAHDLLLVAHVAHCLGPVPLHPRQRLPHAAPRTPHHAQT